MKKIQTGLIGCGKAGKIHADALAELPESQFTAVYDPAPQQAEAFAAAYAVQPFNDLDKFLSSNLLDMVSICSPHPTHPDLSVACLESGLHVLVEKPLAVDLAACDQMLRSAEKNQCQLSVISQRRLYEPVKRVKDAILSGKIGKPILATLTVLGWRGEEYYQADSWRGRWDTEGGGVLVNQTSHHLDLFQWFMGPVSELFGYWANLNHPYIEVEDTAVAVIKFRSGALGSILVSNSQKPGFYGKIHVHGEKGYSVGVQTDGGSPFVAGVTTSVDPPINDVWTIPGEESQLAGWQEQDRQITQDIDIMSHYHKLQIQDFLQAILEDREPMIPAEQARNHVELFTGIYQSQERGEVIRFPIQSDEYSD